MSLLFSKNRVFLICKNTILFNLLNNKQINDEKKIKFCNHTVVNEKNLNILKKKLLDIINKYE